MTQKLELAGLPDRVREYGRGRSSSRWATRAPPTWSRWRWTGTAPPSRPRPAARAARTSLPARRSPCCGPATSPRRTACWSTAPHPRWTAPRALLTITPTSAILHRLAEAEGDGATCLPVTPGRRPSGHRVSCAPMGMGRGRHNPGPLLAALAATTAAATAVLAARRVTTRRRTSGGARHLAATPDSSARRSPGAHAPLPARGWRASGRRRVSHRRPAPGRRPATDRATHRLRRTGWRSTPPDGQPRDSAEPPAPEPAAAPRPEGEPRGRGGVSRGPRVRGGGGSAAASGGGVAAETGVGGGARGGRGGRGAGRGGDARGRCRVGGDRRLPGPPRRPRGRTTVRTSRLRARRWWWHRPRTRSRRR